MIHSSHLAPSHSRLACWHGCRRKYFYGYGPLRLASKQEFPPAYSGSVGHVALEVFHRTGSVDRMLAAARQAWGDKAFYGDWGFLTLGHLKVLLQNYAESKHTRDWEIVRLRRSDLKQELLLDMDAEEDDDGYLMLAEASFVINIPGVGPVNIRPDLLLRVNGGLCVVDHKFKTGYLGSKMYNEAKYSHQLRLYALALGALIGEPVVQGRVNGIFAGAKASTPKFGGQRFDIAGPFDYDDDFAETVAWYKAGVEGMKEFHLHYTEADELQAPQNPTANCGYCDYAALCAAAPAYRSGLIRLNYARRAA